MTVLPVLNTIFAGIAALAALAGALIAFAALRISMASRAKAEGAARAAAEASASDVRTRTAVAEALDELALPQQSPSFAPTAEAPGSSRLSAIAGRLRRGE